MEGLTAAESWTVLQAADQPTRVEIFAYLDREKQIEIIETCDPEKRQPVDRRHAGRRPRRPARTRSMRKSRDELTAADAARAASRHSAAAIVSGGHGRRDDDDRSGPACPSR